MGEGGTPTFSPQIGGQRHRRPTPHRRTSVSNRVPLEGPHRRRPGFCPPGGDERAAVASTAHDHASPADAPAATTTTTATAATPLVGAANGFCAGTHRGGTHGGDSPSTAEPGAATAHNETVPTNRVTAPPPASNGLHARRPATRALLPTDPGAGPVPSETPQHRSPLPVPVGEDPEPAAPRDCAYTLYVHPRSVKGVRRSGFSSSGHRSDPDPLPLGPAVGRVLVVVLDGVPWQAAAASDHPRIGRRRRPRRTEHGGMRPLRLGSLLGGAPPTPAAPPSPVSRRPAAPVRRGTAARRPPPARPSRRRAPARP